MHSSHMAILSVLEYILKIHFNIILPLVFGFLALKNSLGRSLLHAFYTHGHSFSS